MLVYCTKAEHIVSAIVKAVNCRIKLNVRVTRIDALHIAIVRIFHTVTRVTLIKTSRHLCSEGQLGSFRF